MRLMRVITSPSVIPFARTSAAIPFGSTSFTNKPLTPARCRSAITCGVSSLSVKPRRASLVLTVGSLFLVGEGSASRAAGRSARVTLTVRRSSLPSASRGITKDAVSPTGVAATFMIRSWASRTGWPLNSTTTSLTCNPALKAGVGWPPLSACTSAMMAPFASGRP